MRDDFVQIEGKHFCLHHTPIRLRGYTLGSWMNLEHFMMGMPGTNSMIHEAFAQVYGRERAELFFERLLESMVGPADIAFLRGLGTNTLRIPLGYHWFLDDLHPDTFVEKGFQQLERVVELCRRNGLRVILDLHSAPGGQNNDWHSDNRTGQSLFWQYDCFQEQTCRLWREIARRYANDPWVIGYDVLNEPTYGLDREAINGFYARVTAAIREVDPYHILFLEGEDFGRSFELLDAPRDEQTTFAVHFYPFVLEEDVLDPAMPDERRWAIFEQIFYRQLQALEHFDRPLWCGESGYNLLEGQEDFYRKLLLKNISLCEQNGLSWSIWTYKDARRMGIVVPGKDSPWMRFRARVEQKWTHEWEQETSMRLTRSLWELYQLPVCDRLAYDLDFRVRSILHRLEVEEILKPALAQTPWEQIIQYPASFAFENCEKRQTVIDGLREVLSSPD